ncbi:fasciclin domain-containing protein [Algoriphagus aquimarinus]|uniref:Uncaracterized surface protein containing fasciclin (FAS1) repeats n=1 Tax=Algoriphagus aquimarinus TaxID=237018 RepID=A0A1I1CDC1_9BACT|nr:fasciclin domain-containing protein [Algoriphagus aquimarinus]SFB60417.1 Uncaracterized surface protein containing fasciclin (FAS1) repeats [Algoriphagus aquimarinus]
MKKLRLLSFLAAASVASFTISCDSKSTTETEETTMAEVVEETPVMETPNTVVDIAIGSPDHTTLVAAVEAADLVETLKGEGPFTVFAPTNAAFNALPAGTVEGLLKPEAKADLTSILTYHVVAGNVMSGDLKDGQMVTTLNGKELKVTIQDGKVMIGDATVVAADLAGSNGVVHVIDKVLLP